MNLFVAATGSSAEASTADRVTGALRCAAAWFPALANQPIELATSRSGRSLIANVSHDALAARPRVYRWSSNDAVLVYDGLPLTTGDNRRPWDAQELERRFSTLTDDLEGAFAVVRLDRRSDTLEIVTDPLGNLATYQTLDADGTHFVSNSLLALVAVSGRVKPDLVGISTFVSLGWFGEGRTVLDGVRQLRGGSRTRMRPTLAPASTPYFGPASARASVAGAHDVGWLRGRLERQLTSAAGQGHALRLGLTGGRDSRVCLALALELGLDVELYTEGAPGDFDVETARRLARFVGVDHTVVERSAPPVHDLEKAIRTYVGQSDCSSSFSQLVDHFADAESAESLGIKILGLGGEVARASASTVRGFLVAGEPAARLQIVQRRLTRMKARGFAGLLTPETRSHTHRYIDRWFLTRRAEAWPNRLLAETLYVFDSMIRVHQGSVRRAAVSADLVAPLSSRPFIQHAATRTPGDLYAERVHVELLRATNRKMLAFELDTPWAPRRPELAPFVATTRLVRSLVGGKGRDGAKAGKPQAHAGWEAQRALHHEVVEGADNSVAFSAIDRNALLGQLGPGGTRTAGLDRALAVVWWLELARSTGASGDPRTPTQRLARGDHAASTPPIEVSVPGLSDRTVVVD